MKHKVLLKPFLNSGCIYIFYP